MYFLLLKIIDPYIQSPDKCFDKKCGFVWSVEVKLLIIEFEIRESVSFDLKRPNIMKILIIIDLRKFH